MCCKSHTHAANIKFQPNACSSCFKQYFPFLLEGRIYIIILLSPLPVLIILLNPLPVLVALKILREILSFTRSFMINTRLLVGCLENSDRKSETIPCYISDCFKSPCLLFVNAIHWPNLNVSGSAMRLPICIAKLSRNRHGANQAAWLEWLLK